MGVWVGYYEGVGVSVYMCLCYIINTHILYAALPMLQVVYVTKLLNDLSFWAEVERYKDIADIVRETKRGRQGTPEDDIIVHKKAHAIINCYIDSAVIPRVQVCHE